jgi:hypothetical protein
MKIIKKDYLKVKSYLRFSPTKRVNPVFQREDKGQLLYQRGREKFTQHHCEVFKTMRETVTQEIAVTK